MSGAAGGSAVERVLAAARERGLEVEIREFPEGTRTAADAARAVGCGVEQIVKSLVFMADDEPVIAYVSGLHRLDTAKLAVATGAAQVRRATAEEAREATGYAIGGTPPFGHAKQLRLYLDETLMSHPEVWCAGGTPTTVFAIDPGALLKATGAQVDNLHEDPSRPV